MSLTFFKCPRCGCIAAKIPYREICILCFIFEIRSKEEAKTEEEKLKKFDSLKI
jgi:hypothetical protein